MPVTYKGTTYYQSGEPIDHHDIDTRHPIVLSPEAYAAMERLVKEKKMAAKEGADGKVTFTAKVDSTEAEPVKRGRPKKAG